MTCLRCGAEAAPGSAFCSGCGLNLTLPMVAVATPPEYAPRALVPGRRLEERLRAALAPRYELVREAGRGGMATVFLARELDVDGTGDMREVAVKVLHPELAATLGADRFEREIRVATQLRHPHILGMFDSGSVDGLLYYVMPFVTGESLRDRIAREGQLPIDEAVQLAREVAAALDHAHAEGFVHRDIKPENILLQDGHAVVADFGIARALSEAETQKLTQTGMAVGTPVYMAPEQAVAERVGPAADIYSLGCVLYEMLAGEPPFMGNNAVSIMARHALEPPRSIRVVRASVSETIEDAIFAALEKSPADRPKTAGEFAARLTAAPGTVSAQGRTHASLRRLPSGAYPAPAPRPRWRTPALLAGVAAVVLGAAGAWKAGWFGGSPPPTLGPDARRVAVLYFDDRSPQQTLTPLADGLTEGLIDALGSAPSLTVISRAGVERFRGTTLAADSIARLLRAGWLVRGSVEPEARDVRVTLRLDDASGVNVRSVSFVRPAVQLVALRDTLGTLAAELLRTQLGEELRLKEQRASTANPAAWLLAQRGEQARKRGEALAKAGDAAGFDAAFRTADSLLVLAAAADPRWVEPLVQRAAVSYRRSRLVGRDPTLIRPWVDSGLVQVGRAIALAPRDADALELRGNLRYWSWLMGLEADAERQRALLDSARADLERATAIAPRQAGAWASLSHLYNQTPTTTSAEVQIAAQRALEADEFLSNADVILGRLFLSSYDLGQFDKAAQWCTALGARFPANALAARCRLYQLTTRLQTPDIAQAWRLADSTVALAPPAQQALQRRLTSMFVAAVIARASRATPALADSARRVVQRADGDRTVDPTADATYVGAWVHVLLGDRDAALRLLRVYLALNPARTVALRNDPGWWFRDIADEPRFRQLVGHSD